MKSKLTSFLVVCVLCTVVWSQTSKLEEEVGSAKIASQIPWDVIAAGGIVGSISGGYELSASTGQTGVDLLETANYRLYSGFWNPHLINQITIVEAEDDVNIPKAYQLNHNYPNPFNPETTIQYALPKASDVSIEIYNLIGHQVKLLIDEAQEPGYHSIRWDGKDSFGRAVGSGIYFYRMVARSLEGQNFVQSRKMTLVK